VAVWEDLVATGLIGTDRRPVPDELPRSWGAELEQALDPAHAVLALAARHRAAHRAGGRLPSCPPGRPAPRDREPVASGTAHEILARLLTPPRVDLLNLWLLAAAEHGQRVSAAYWTSLAMLAARSTELQRPALARALGERGVWFIEQNPEWSRLAKALRSHPKEDASTEPNPTVVSEDALRANPELIFRVPSPWPNQLTQTVLEIIVSGRLQQRGARYAPAVGALLPLQHYELVRSAVQHIRTGDLALSPAGVRSVREALLSLERTVWLRIEMQSAFSGDPIMVQRLEIRPW
jgi:hypothetical protein